MFSGFNRPRSPYGGGFGNQLPTRPPQTGGPLPPYNPGQAGGMYGGPQWGNANPPIYGQPVTGGPLPPANGMGQDPGFTLQPGQIPPSMWNGPGLLSGRR